jgi:hypothetical protein
MIGGVVRSITGAISIPANAGTNWLNAGSAELATKEIDFFVFLRYSTSDSATLIGFTRYPGVNIISDFTASATAEKGRRISGTATATDQCVIIGRFAATLSAGAGYTWSVPTFTASNLIQRPIYETRWLDWLPTITYSGGTTDPTSNTVNVARYRLSGNMVNLYMKSTLVFGSGNRTATFFTLPIGRFDTSNLFFSSSNTITGASIYGSAYTNDATKITYAHTMSSNGTYVANGFYHI